MFNERKDIIDWLESNQVDNFTVNYDLSVDVTGDVVIISKEEIVLPVQFGCIDGDFVIRPSFKKSDVRITTLKGAPPEVRGNFIVRNNHLTYLDYSPVTVGGNFDCSSNLLRSLWGCRSQVSGDFDCSGNHLVSLEGAPSRIGGSFYCMGNRLKTLKGVPKTILGDLNCRYNPELFTPLYLSLVKGALLSDINQSLIKVYMSLVEKYADADKVEGAFQEYMLLSAKQK